MSFDKLFASYKHYDPKVEGHGSPSDWKRVFAERMGFEEAERIILGQDDTPRGILGVSLTATWAEIKKAYRALVMKVHPDQCAQTGLSVEDATERFKRVQAAYAVLANQLGQ
jgi:hypothetical protein